MSNTSNVRLGEMITRIARGDREAFSEIFATTSARLHALCLSIVKDRPEAEETLQEAYVKIWQTARDYPNSGLSPATWLMTTARNCAIDRLRSKRSLPPVRLPAKTSFPPLQDSLANQHQRERVRLGKCLSQLNDDQRATIRAVYLEGKSYTDLSGGKPVSEVRNKLRLGLLGLKECVSK